jgi:hypothetical protein
LGVLALRGEDWLSQLNDRRIVFDTRQNLGNNYREYPMIPYLSAGTRFNAVRTTDIWTVITDLGQWADDTYNGMKLVVPHKYLGSQTDIQYPYDEVVVPDAAPMTTDTPAAGETNVHDADGTVHRMTDDANWLVAYYFRSLAAHSSLVDSIDRVTLTFDSKFTPGAGAAYAIFFYDYVAADFITCYVAGSAYDHTDPDVNRRTFELPQDWFDRIFDADGYAIVAVTVGTAVAATLDVDFIQLKIEYTVDTAHNDVHTISDTSGAGAGYNRLTLADDVEDDGFVDYWPFSITQAVTIYVASLIGTYDALYALDATDNVTASTHYVARHFHYETPLQILRELARADNTDFWLDAWDGNSLDLHWNDTYPVAGAPTWTDTDVLHWTQCSRRLSDVINEWIIDGLATGDYKVSATDSDANSITDYGRRTGYFNNPDIAVNQEATDEADRRVDRTKDARFNIGALWNGFKTTTLGSVVTVNSTKFSVNTTYVIVEKEYDSRAGVTAFMLTPRATVLNPPTPLSHLARRIDERLVNLESRLERGSRYTEVWS